MLKFNTEIPIVKIPLNADVELFIKREDLVHPSISGNKFWKLYYNIIQYLKLKKKSPLIITFGGAFSNHIAAVSSLGQALNIPTIGIIRGEELQNTITQNPTLKQAQQNGMQLRFVTREDYRNQSNLTELLQVEFPNALLIPEGGSNVAAVNGIQLMLNEQTKDFDYLCCAVGTGGTISGLSKYAEPHQKVIGIKVVKDDSLEKLIINWSLKENFSLKDAFQAKYGKITEDNIRFINRFYQDYNIPLDPIYTGKMMEKLLALIDENYFEKGSRILAFHTGGLQGISGANDWLKKKNKLLIEF